MLLGPRTGLWEVFDVGLCGLSTGSLVGTEPAFKLVIFVHF